MTTDPPTGHYVYSLPMDDSMNEHIAKLVLFAMLTVAEALHSEPRMMILRRKDDTGWILYGLDTPAPSAEDNINFLRTVLADCRQSVKREQNKETLQ
jgi:hypothetical protein